jgi:hypothetical protein
MTEVVVTDDQGNAVASDQPPRARANQLDDVLSSTRTCEILHSGQKLACGRPVNASVQIVPHRLY